MVDNLTTLMEPMIMAVLGVLVGGLIIAMYLPIFQRLARRCKAWRSSTAPAASPVWFTACTLLLGLLVGSFLMSWCIACRS